MKKLFGYFIVLSLPMWGQAVSPTINQTPTRQFGHPTLAVPLTQASPNLVEGRELNAPGQIAFDTSVNPPILYVADIANNRVLGFKSIAKLSAGNFADLVIGQQDFVSTLAQGGAGSTLSTGLNSPTGLAVNSKGDLYVADSGNNRILRFPAPFNQPAGNPPQPDLVIGQKSYSSGTSPNEGGNAASKTVAFSQSGQTFLTSLAIDGSGNLWTTDPLNNRVLMYPVANLSPNAVEPVATVVLGQNDFITSALASSNQLSKSVIVQPSSLAFDAAGNLYVADGYSRVLYFQGPNFLSQGQAALRLLGLSPPQQAGQPATVFPNQYSLGFPNANNQLIPPSGVFTLGNNVFVADTPANRIVEYDIPSKWAPESTAFPSPQALAVYGQVGFAVGQPNQGQAQPNQFTVAGPYAGAFVGTGTAAQMWISDTGNNRVLAFSPSSGGTYSGASAVVGQLDYIYNAPNLIVGQEVFLSGGGLAAAGIVVDKNSSPPHLYVADPGNNRILCFKNALTVGQISGTPADLVIGQPDFKTSQINFPNGIALSPSATGLHTPIGVAVDNNGNLYVADEGNGRVLRFPAPFSQAPGTQPTANLVLGQSSFTSLIQNASSNSMHSPWGVALFADASGNPLAGGLAVSDPSFQRVLLFKKPAGGDFTIGQSASIVIGQSSFSTVAPGTGPANFNSPRGIASDTSDRLYVADTSNNRVMVFTQAPEGITNGPTSTFQINQLNQPQGVAVSSLTTELWIANTSGFQILRYPDFTHCQTGTCAATAQLFSSGAPLGLALDGSDNVVVGDAANRVTFYFARAFFRHAANFNTQALAPGMLGALGRLGLPMKIQDAAATTSPWPTTLADLNLSVNGTLAPIFNTNSGFGAIFFQVPYEAPTSGTANFIVTQKSTGAVLSVGTFQMTTANPGFFTTSQNGIGPVIARNLVDNSLNTAGNQVARGADVEFCLTGYGNAPGAPPDGAPPSGTPSTGIAPVLFIGGVTVTTIGYSGLGCGFPGGWQINATIPIAVAPGQWQVVLTYLDIQSNIGGTTNPDGTPGPDIKLVGSSSTTVFVK